jgi:hypothetical protein
MSVHFTRATAIAEQENYLDHYLERPPCSCCSSRASTTSSKQWLQQGSSLRADYFCCSAQQTPPPAPVAATAVACCTMPGRCYVGYIQVLAACVRCGRRAGMHKTDESLSVKQEQLHAYNTVI